MNKFKTKIIKIKIKRNITLMTSIIITIKLFFIFLKINAIINYYQIRIENKVGIKLSQLHTECATGVTKNSNYAI